MKIDEVINNCEVLDAVNDQDKFEELKSKPRPINITEEDFKRMWNKYHTPWIRETKIRPNSPCLCGSGKKYKKCCGKLVNETEYHYGNEIIKV